MRNYDRICECCNSLKKKHKWYRFPLFFFRCRPRPKLINRLFFIPKNQFFTMKLSLVTCFLCKKFKTRLSFWWMLAELKNMFWKKNYSSKKISEEIPDSVFLCKKLTISYFNFSNSSNSTIFLWRICYECTVYWGRWYSVGFCNEPAYDFVQLILRR